MLGILSKKCHFCKEKIDGKSIKAKVKVPGYYGHHKKDFCSKKHYLKYKKFIKNFEKQNGKIPESSGCTTCAANIK